MTASVPTWTTLWLPIAHKHTPVARPSLSVDVWFCCRQKAIRLSVFVLQPQSGGRNQGSGEQLMSGPLDEPRREVTRTCSSSHRAGVASR